jgi:hypothetical protein
MKKNKIAHTNIKPQNIVICADGKIGGQDITSLFDSF